MSILLLPKLTVNPSIKRLRWERPAFRAYSSSYFHILVTMGIRPVFFLLWLNLFDGVATMYELGTGAATEGNPLLSRALALSPLLAWSVKLVVLPVVLVLLLVAGRTRPWVPRALWLLVAAYGAVSCLHLSQLSR